jgi:hypothetical protein
VEFVGWGVLALIAAIVVVPLAREYAEFRRGWGLGRIAAFATTALVVPALGVGYALAVPLGAHPGLQWLTTVLAALVAYSLAVRGVEEVVDASPDRGPARPR